MSKSPKDIDPADVDRAIAHGFRLLRFDTNLERQFEAETGDRRCRHMIVQNYIGLMVYHCFLVSDYVSVGDVFALDLFVHFLVMTPVVLVLHGVLARRPALWLRESAEVAGIVVLSLTIVAVGCSSRLPDRDLLLFTLTLVVLFAVIMQRIRFRYLVAACAFVQASFTGSLSTVATFPMERLLLFNSIFLGIVVFALVGAYNLEHEHRMGYLLSLRDRLRTRDLEITSSRDALTGIGNRRALDAALLREMVRGAAEPGRHTAVLLMDIDHFKAFNDTNGHQAGDACLRRVAGIIAESVRGGSAYRFGGEEFLVLLEATGLDEAAATAERIRARIACARIPRGGGAEAVVTISIGVASGRFGAGIHPDALVAAADRALYEAKRRGRDRVATAPDDDRAAAPAAARSLTG